MRSNWGVEERVLAHFWPQRHRCGIVVRPEQRQRAHGRHHRSAALPCPGGGLAT